MDHRAGGAERESGVRRPDAAPPTSDSMSDCASDPASDSGTGPSRSAREPLPLPRRSGQAHLAAQLRSSGSAGTAFAAFAAGEPTAGAADRPASGGDATERAVAFLRAARRERGDAGGNAEYLPGQPEGPAASR